MQSTANNSTTSRALVKVVGFTGPRNLTSKDCPFLTAIIEAVLRRGDSIVTGCASGLDQMVVTTTAAIDAKRLRIYTASKKVASGTEKELATQGKQHIAQARQQGGRVIFGGVITTSDKDYDQGSGTAIRTQRPKISYAAHLAKRSQRMVLEANVVIGIVNTPCPPNLHNLVTWQSGHGSGTWQTLAYAAGLGKKVVVFAARGLTSDFLPSWKGGEWRTGEGGGEWKRAFIWEPVKQLSYLAIITDMQPGNATVAIVERKKQNTFV